MSCKSQCVEVCKDNCKVKIMNTALLSPFLRESKLSCYKKGRRISRPVMIEFENNEESSLQKNEKLFQLGSNSIGSMKTGV